MKSLLLASIFALAGCSPIVDRCHDDTLLVAVTLDAASAAANTFEVAISIDGVPSSQSTIAHTPGATDGNLVVTFPHGYPRGHTVGVGLRALVSGRLVGAGSASQPLPGACEVAPLSVAATAPADLGANDLRTADLAGGPADLARPPDMTCVPTSETGSACFDGIDNDCDGHIDCDDPDCTAVAECVPTPSSGFVLGIAVPQASFCPGMFVQQEVINEGLTPASPQCPTSACTCTGQMTCSANFTSYSGSQGCSGEAETVSIGSTCRNWNVNQTTTALESSTIGAGAGQCVQGGSSARGSVSWTTSDNFCKTTAVGGGCPVGNQCVPRLAAAKICELSDGAAACDSGYSATGGPWFHDYSDQRTCACACGAATGGACGNAFAVYSTTNCSNTPVLTLAPSSSSCNISAASGGTFHSTVLTGGTQPSCGAPTATASGTLTGTGPKTLCCRP